MDGGSFTELIGRNHATAWKKAVMYHQDKGFYQCGQTIISSVIGSIFIGLCINKFSGKGTFSLSGNSTVRFQGAHATTKPFWQGWSGAKG